MTKKNDSCFIYSDNLLNETCNIQNTYILPPRYEQQAINQFHNLCKKICTQVCQRRSQDLDTR